MRIGHHRVSIGLAIGAFLAPAGVEVIAAQQTVGVPSSVRPDPDTEAFEARVWLDRGDEPVLARGDDVRVYYRTTDDAFVAIFRIDTDGGVSLLFPQDPGVDNWVQAGRDYRLLLDGTPRWRVRDDPGMGYFFMIASPDPMDFSLFDFDERRGWDLRAVGETLYEDPYVAIDEYVAAILPEWEVVPYGLDFLSYSVGEQHEYPRFLCYDCHEQRSYATWNPYAYPCDSYQIVVWNDPYFAPRYRYAGTRVVFARPFGPRPRYDVSVRPRGALRGVVVLERAAPPRRGEYTVYKESARPPRPSARPGASPRPAVSSRPATASRGTPSPRPSASPRASGPVSNVRPTTATANRTRPSAASEVERRAATRAPVSLPAAARPGASGAASGRRGARASRPPTARAAPSPAQATRAAPSRPQASRQEARPEASRPQDARPQASRSQASRPQAPPSQAARSAPSRPGAPRVAPRAPAPPAAAPARDGGRGGSAPRPTARRRGG